ncbi:MAG: csy [Gammaproteobacteria bacterium]|nr:csy [Gammaproteobacteria bacterium]
MESFTKQSEIAILKTLIENFIQTRMQDKLAKEKEVVKQEAIKQAYQTENWLSDAARRVSQIQLATHPIKFQNPDARGSSIYIAADQLDENPAIVSTHTLMNRKADVVGNAAALDVFKFLQLSHANKTLLERVLENDANLVAALSGTEQQKTAWLSAFAGIAQPKGVPATHTLAKQIYFPVADNDYHLLAPLFPSCLAQAVYEDVQTHFVEEVINARRARKENKPHPHGYREYLNLAVQNFGGSKPQNVSLLNSARGGKAYLLPSLPPKWQAADLKPPLKLKSIFSLFRYRVRDTLKELRKLLTKASYFKSNVDIRDARATLVAEICDQLLFFAAQLQNLPAGWSADPLCKLPEAEALWLDSGRALIDEAWRLKRQTLDWQSQIGGYFGLWLNGVLGTKKLIFGDDEYQEWKKLLERELALLLEDVS